MKLEDQPAASEEPGSSRGKNMVNAPEAAPNTSGPRTSASAPTSKY